jgi:CBS domain containing-hemolysin-like protein
MELNYLTDILRLIAVAILVLANGFFVAAEFALVSVRSTRIAELVKQGNKSAVWVKKAIDNPDRFIAATQLGITLASLGLGWIGEPALSHLLQPVIELFPAAVEAEVSHSIAVGLSFAIITFLHVVVGELAPKSIALQSPERTSLVVAQPTVWTERIFKPAIWALNGAGNALLRLLGMQLSDEHSAAHSIDEIKMLVSASAQSGVFASDEEDMVNAIFDLENTPVRQLMVPRTEMIALPSNASLDDILKISIEDPYTKMPVYLENLDHIVGVVHLKDVVRARHGANQTAKTAADLMREALFVPESAKVRTLLNLLRMRRRHIAIVLDEFGGTAGVVTLEDLLEEIVGEVDDPFASEPEIQPLPNGSTLIEGLMSIDEVNDHFKIQLHDPDYDTIAGFILGNLGRLASVGDTIHIDGYNIRVEQMDGLRIDRVSLTPEKSPIVEVEDEPTES